MLEQTTGFASTLVNGDPEKGNPEKGNMTIGTAKEARSRVLPGRRS